jgi:hypothetical protein
MSSDRGSWGRSDPTEVDPGTSERHAGAIGPSSPAAPRPRREGSEVTLQVPAHGGGQLPAQEVNPEAIDEPAGAPSRGGLHPLTRRQEWAQGSAVPLRSPGEESWTEERRSMGREAALPISRLMAGPVRNSPQLLGEVRDRAQRGRDGEGVLVLGRAMSLEVGARVPGAESALRRSYGSGRQP